MTRVSRLPVPLRVVVLVAGSVVLLMTAMWVLQRRLIFFPDRSAAGPPARAVPGAQDLTLHTDDGLELQAWLVPPPDRADRRVAVLVAPGNAGNRADRVPLAVALAGDGLTVLLLDYRGYGGNPGSPSEDGLARDARAARAYLIGRPACPPTGCSTSARAWARPWSTGLATEHPPAGLVLRSPFTDLAAVGPRALPVPAGAALLRDRYPVAEQVARVGVPTTWCTAPPTRSCRRSRAARWPSAAAAGAASSRSTAPTTTTRRLSLATSWSKPSWRWHRTAKAVSWRRSGLRRAQPPAGGVRRSARIHGDPGPAYAGAGLNG